MRERHGREREAGYLAGGMYPTVLGNVCHPIGRRAGSATAVFGPTQPTRAYIGTFRAVCTSLEPEVSANGRRILVNERTYTMATHIIPKMLPPRA